MTGVSFDIFAFGDVAAAAPVAAREFLIAVLPFDNLSGDSEMVYFSDGVSEDILQAVAQTTKLKVAARTSSFQFRGPDKAAHKVAAELKATHLLDGSVRRSGTRVRISAHLIECAGQKQLWSDRFDRDLSDVFALQDEIAGAVAKALQAAFAPLMARGAVDPSVYEDYLRVRAQIAAAVPWSVTAGFLEDIVTRAPEFAQAWASLAMCLGAYISVENNLPYRIAGARETCALAADRALALDPSAGIAYVARYALEPRCGAYEAREALLQKARAVSPNDPTVLNASSLSAKALGRRREAFAYSQRAHELDPLYAQGVNWYAVMLSETGRIDEAYRVFSEGARRWPKFDSLIANPISVAACLEDWEQVDAFIADAKAAGLDTPDIRGVSKLAQMKRNDDQAAIERRLARFRERVARNGRVTFNDMCLLSALGRTAEAFDAIEDLSFAHLFTPEGKLEQGDYGIHNIMNASFPALRRDPRFVTLCAKLGLCAYWVKSQRWPDFADEVQYDFKRACTEAVAAA